MNAMIPGHTSTAYPTDRGNCSEAIRNLNPATSPITPNMKTTPRLSRRAAVLAVLLVPCAFMHAQTAAAPAAATAAEKDDIVVLSPFEVKSTSGSNAYTADSTLAGNRLSTQLRDIGSSLTVVTSQFLLDTGATDNTSLLQRLGGTEVGVVNGNFASAGSCSPATLLTAYTI